MRQLHPFVCALTVGLVFALWHFVWSIMVAMGFARVVLDMVLRLHFLEIGVKLLPFSLSNALMLVGGTFSVGFLVGLLFALIWNWLTLPAPRSERPSDDF